MAKKNQLVEAKNPPEKKKKESQVSAPEQIQIFEELERKKKVKLSIASYAIGRPRRASGTRCHGSKRRA